MKFIIVADIHFENPNDEGFSMQEKHTEQAKEILAALGKAAVEKNAEFIIHAGDLINFGTGEEISKAAACCSSLPVPFYTVLGNHDCIMENFEELWLKNGASLFPEGTLETTFVRGGLRFDLLNNSWGKNSSHWIKTDGFITRLAPRQFERLRSGDQTLPRIMVFHSQIRPVYPSQTGKQNDIHLPTNEFDKVGDEIIREFHPLLIAGGHNHVNVLEKIESTYAVTASSLTEAPFEYKLLDFTDGKLSMQTCSLENYVSFPFSCKPEQKFVQGREIDRSF